MRIDLSATFANEEREQFLKDAQKIVDGTYPRRPLTDGRQRQGDMPVKMVIEIARRWDDLGLDYEEACGLYNPDVIQAIYTQQLENVGLLKRWVHKRSCQKWERKNSDVMNFMSQANQAGKRTVILERTRFGS